MKKQLIAFLFLSHFAVWQYATAAPIPYSGKVAINGANFQGDAQFTFALRDANGTIHWRNGPDANASINVPVDRGLYVVLLGGQGMNALPSSLFLEHHEIYLETHFYRDDTQEWLHMLPDQRITSAPHALAADVANLANLAKAVLPGAITKSMLAAEVLADLNATVVVSEQNNTGQIVSITRDMLPWDVLQDLNGTISRSRLSVDVLDDLNQSIKAITRDMLPWDVLQDLNGTIARSRLSADVLDDLNQSIKDITRNMLPWDVLQDLNGTISRSRLSVDVLDDLNQSIKVITRDMLPWDVLQDLNGTISRSRLSVDVLDDLNQSIKVITRDMLPWDVLQDLNGTISRSRLSVDVLDDLNQSIKVITRDMLPWDVLQDLNGTISRSRLSVDVLDDLNQSIKVITRAMLPADVRYDLNGTIPRWRLSADVLDDLNESIKTITRAMLPWDVLQDLNGTISRSRLSVDVLDDLNQSIKVITRDMLPWDVLQDLNGTISRSRLSVDVLDDLNQSIKVITRDMLPWDVLQDLNGTISRSRLSVDVLDDLNQSIKVITRDMLPWDVLQDLNGTISRSRLSVDVLDDLNQSIKVITRDMLPWDVLQDLNGTIARSRLSVDVLDDLNQSIKVITRDMLPWDVLQDLNGTISRSRLSVDVLDDLNQSIKVITRDMLPWDVLQDLNGTIPRWRLAGDVLADLNATITRSRLAADILTDLNRTFTISPGTVTETMLAAGTVTPGKLSPDVTAALKPVILQQPQSMSTAGGASATFAMQATGVNLSYQWLQQGYAIAGANGNDLTIADLNATLHDGNYTVMVTNAFGSTESAVATLDVNGSVTQGLVGWWKFDETNGTVAHDSSGNENNGTLVNGPTWTQGKIGGALSFDGVDDRLQLPKSTLNGRHAFSYLLWFKMKDDSATRHAFLSGSNNASGNEILFWTIDFELSVQDHNLVRGETNSFDSSFWVNSWKMLSYVRTVDGMTVFVDGQEVKSISYSTNPLNIHDNGLWIGPDQDSVGGGWESNQFLKGLIDDVRIYDRALSAAEVQALYDLGTVAASTTGGGTTIVADSGPVTTENLSDGAVTTAKLSETILKYLRPEITSSPQPVTVNADTNATFSVSAEGKYLNYQWKRNGVDLVGETNATLTITDANATLHDGNYTVTVSNEFGSVESNAGELSALPFSPASFSLVLWLDASDSSSIVETNNKMSEWIDKSGNENLVTQATSARQPTYNATGFNGKPTLTFADDWLDASITAASFTLAYVAQSTHNTSAVYYPVGTGGTTGAPFGGTFAGQTIGLYNDNGQSVVSTNTATLNTPTIFTGTATNGARSVWVNGQGNATDTNSQSISAIRIGKRADSNWPFNGDISEIIIYSATLSTSDRQKIEGYLAHKWGLADKLPANHPYKNSAP